MNRVFVTQYPMRRDQSGTLVAVHDISPAAKYGKIEILLQGGPVLLSTGHLVRDLKSKLHDYCDNDYLLCMGDPAVIATAAAIAALKNQGRYRLLIWDRPTTAYLPVEVDLFDFEGEDAKRT